MNFEISNTRQKQNCTSDWRRQFCNQTPLKARQINLFCICELLLKPQNRRHGHKEERRRPKREGGLLLSLVHIHTSSLATLNIFIWTERDFTITHIFSKLASLFLKKSQNCNYLICHTLSWGNSLIVSNWWSHAIVLKTFLQTHNERSCQCVCQCSCQNQCHCFVLKTFFLRSVHFIQIETSSVYIFILVKKKFANVFLLLRWRKLLSVCYVWGNF